ncbi:MAG: rRNA maturation RNase YbeY [Planctomycetes bacterium]|nr:rRNA maturation RNase YbeY [Planctomycetota bacterium]
MERCARRTANAEGFDRGSLSIAVVGAAAMTTLHRLHLGREEPTDVLTFDLGTDCRHGILDGEIVLCADMARRRAAARDKTLATARAELALYLVHGLLHLAGYDDRDAATFRRMHRREDEILATLGLGGVFQDGA